MAKRKRLSPAEPVKTPALETKSAFPTYKDGWQGVRPPIAHVAGDAAASAALAELTDEVSQARASGRMIVELPLDAIDPSYLVRDRIAVDEDDMQSLMASIRSRGQQTPIEVADIGNGKYGLISGWRRLQALGRLATAGDARPALALLRSPEDSAEAYLAMVEENEIRVGLSYYERARIVAVAVGQKAFSSEKEALQQIYHAASRAKRSKIRSFLTIVNALDGVLAFPAALGERAGLALAKALETRPDLGPSLRRGLTEQPPKTAEEEATRIATALSAGQPKPRRKAHDLETVAPRRLPQGVRVETRKDGTLTLSGPGFTPELCQKLFDWLGKQ